MATALDSQPRCELCGSKKSTNWKCCECSQLMCRRCKKLHVKANISKFHNFVSLKSEKDSNDRCPRHRSEICHMECKTCQEFVCEKCVKQNHVGHNTTLVYQSLEKERELCKLNLSDFKDASLSLALKEMETFRQLSDEYKAGTKLLLKEVTSRYQTFVSKVKDMQDQALQQIQNIYKLDMGYYETEGKLRENLILQMDEIIQNFDKKIREAVGIRGLMKLRSIERHMKEMMLPSKIQQKVVPKFTCSELDIDAIRSQFGQLCFKGDDVNSDESSSVPDKDGGLPIPSQNGTTNTTEYDSSTSTDRDSVPDFKIQSTRSLDFHPRSPISSISKGITMNGDTNRRHSMEHFSGKETKSPPSRWKTSTIPFFDDFKCEVSLEFPHKPNCVPAARSLKEQSDDVQVHREIRKTNDVQIVSNGEPSQKESIFLHHAKSRGNISIHDTFFIETFHKAPNVDKICHVYLKSKAKVCSVCPVGDKAWVGFSDKSVALINGSGDVLKRSRVDLMPHHLAADYTGDIVVCSEKSSVVKSMSPTGAVKDVHKFPVEVGGIYVSRQGTTLVSLPALSKIVRLSDQGEIESEIKYDVDGEALFNSPYALTENIEGNVCVIDGKNDWLNVHKKWVVCVDNRDVVFRYKCDKMTEFQYIACDQYSNILLSDCVNFQIKMLNRMGTYIGVVGRDSLLMVDPRDVVFDEHFNLWVVDDKNRITVAKYVLW